ncbi:asialoglycoprotein receptor 1-like isoform X3 [Sander lucioperca]|uniref:asialoglycoprotein receptor 1-like isoform X3 n=1 Tax=Sander lucioperca TaxID=283035 RepID=UPI00165368E2|nr:asialoglycoprotein receptor 1-like isoform X3 [Sander lucioperca]
MNRNPQEEIEEMEEEAAADYVIVPACTVDKVAARPDQRFRCFSQSFPLIAVCWLILLVIMGLRIYFATLSHERERELMAANRNLTNLNDKLNVLENQITNLTAVNQELETRRNDIIGQIQNMETNWNKLNVSRVKWTIDVHCHKVNNVSERQCKACQQGWELFESSCYLIHPSHGKTWEEAREVCRAQSSDLVVVHDEDEQIVRNYFRRYIYGYWIGLRAEGGRWKWIDGSDLTERNWIQDQQPPPTDGQCVVYVRYKWRSESCAERNGWICKKKALSF